LSAPNTKITKLFIANRGEIACRLLRACRELGISGVVGYSEADKNSLAVTQADEAVWLGPAVSAESYLLGDKVIEAAKRTGCQAIHPGYGFLSENSGFAAAVEKAGLIFVGPTATAMEALGDKARARAQAEKAGVPTPPGFFKAGASAAEWSAAAAKIGFPVLVKAVAGGGGRGIRKVNKAEELSAALESASAEAKSGFGEAQVFLEKCLDRARHIEIQVMGDEHGNVIALGERECSLQRRRQKVWEESPAPKLSAQGRAALLDSAVKLAKSVGYRNAGTLEFLVDDKENFYFLEMNTRLQVEHPVTEMVTRLDLVKMQLAVAEGQKLSLTQSEVSPRGHAIEVRLCAEDPKHGFRPATGKLSMVRFPAGSETLRVETGFQSGDTVPMEYDSLLAKLIAYGETRDMAIGVLRKALEETAILGIPTNRDFLIGLCGDPDVREGNFDISYIENVLMNKPAAKLDSEVETAALTAATALWLSSMSPQTWLPTGFRNNSKSWAFVDWRRGEATSVTRIHYKNYATLEWAMRVGNVEGKGRLLGNGAGLRWEWNGIARPVAWSADGRRLFLTQGETTYVFERQEVLAGLSSRAAKGHIRSPMPGKVSKVLVDAGDVVEEGDVLAVLEAMKLEHSIRAPHPGKVTGVLVKMGQTVTLGAELVTLEETPA